MPGSYTQRNTTTRDRHRAVIRRGKPACGICHQPIDYTLPHMDPGEFVVDHIIPLAKGGLDELDNKQPAHRHCNRVKSDKTDGEIPATAGPRTFVTARTW
ncbi:HNH endonuclease signature motif containing protein [Nocardia sp. NPDC019255]|uniref:HNH endonuclease n=1 Tax=Nocardia sp. NPDC019255 TaxID=3154591 RepID=UPI0033CDA5CD